MILMTGGDPIPADVWGDDYLDDEDGCLHGVPWCDDCWECEMEEDRMEYGIL